MGFIAIILRPEYWHARHRAKPGLKQPALSFIHFAGSLKIQTSCQEPLNKVFRDFNESECR